MSEEETSGEIHQGRAARKNAEKESRAWLSYCIVRFHALVAGNVPFPDHKKCWTLGIAS